MSKSLRPTSGRTDFSQTLVFEPSDFFADFDSGFLAIVFVGEKVPSKILHENPWQNPANVYKEISDAFLETGQDKIIACMKFKFLFSGL